MTLLPVTKQTHNLIGDNTMKDYNDICLRPLEEETVIEQKTAKKDHDDYREIGLKDNQNELQD